MGDVKLHVYHSLHIRVYRLQILGPCIGPKVEPKPSPEILLEARLSLAQTVLPLFQPRPLPKYGFLLLFNSNIWAISAPVRDISFQNLSDLDIDHSRSLSSNVIASMDSPYMLSYHCLIVTYGPIIICSFTRYKASKSE